MHSNPQNRCTPQDIVLFALSVLGCYNKPVIDLCATVATTTLPHYTSNILQFDLTGVVGFCNPPFGLLREVVPKVLGSSEAVIVLLVPAYGKPNGSQCSHTHWYKQLQQFGQLLRDYGYIKYGYYCVHQGKKLLFATNAHFRTELWLITT